MRPVETIEAYLHGGELDVSVRAAVRQVADSGIAEAAPLLRQVAETSSATGNRRVIFDALDGLRKLGEPRNYFVEAARSHTENKWLAYHAMVVLARDAVDDAVWDELLALRAEISDAELLGAIAMAERVRDLENQYQRTSGLMYRLRYVLDTLRTGWNPITLTGGEIDRGTDPQASWGQQKLWELSEQDPQAVAGAVTTLERNGISGPVLWSYRRFVAGFLTEEARERFGRLDPGRGV